MNKAFQKNIFSFVLLITLLVFYSTLYAQEESKKIKSDVQDGEEKKNTLTKRDLRKIRKQRRNDSLTRLIYLEGRLEYKYHVLFAAGLTTDGYKSYAEFGFRTRNKKLGTLLFSTDIISERRSPRQKKIASLYELESGERTIYIYRKQNIFHLINILIGQQYQLGNLFFKKPVSINGYYKTGVSLALLRPYYLRILNNDPLSNSIFEHIKYTPETEDRFLNQSLIVTSSGIDRGWDEIDLVPGFHLEVGVRFYFLSAQYNRKSLLGLECSAGMDIYNEKIGILIPDEATPAQRFYFNGSIVFLLGWRN